MAINIVVAVTDYDWFRTLRDLPNLSEVNFWSPSVVNFRALRPGELYLFKLRGSHNVIAGGGIFAHSNNMPLSLAWQAFGETNGAYSLDEMRRMIAPLLANRPEDSSDFEIGCRILTQPFFFDEEDWFDPPASFARNIVRFKTYNTGDAEGLSLWDAVQERLVRQASRASGGVLAEGAARYGEPQPVRPRLGQGAFRVMVTDTYDRRCAVTRERTLPALDAAHIKPFSTGGQHAISNGLLLRKDIRSLFDAGYVTVRPSLDFAVSPRIREEFENGHEYYDYDGSKILVPQQLEHRPDPDALMWHNENVFKGELR